MPKIPAQWDVGSFSATCLYARTTQAVLGAWNAEAAAASLVNLNNVVRLEIDKFRPDVILTFDPRHGTSCHPDHRAIGYAVISGVNAYTGSNFPDKTKLFLLTTRRIDSVNDLGRPYIGVIPAAARDRTSAVYNAFDSMTPFGKTGWAFVQELANTYPTQFPSPIPSYLENTPPLEATTAFQRITDYYPTDTRYTISNDSRVQTCSN